jgi:RES domain-containing protein
VISACRIVKARHAATAFDGEGARLAGGRWNSAGAPVVYTAGSAALAALEMLVHLGRGATLPAYVLIECAFDESLVVALDRSRLGDRWRAYPAPPRLQQLGDAWLKSGVSAVLEVPSAVIPLASNYLINPRHGDFASIQRSTPEPFEYDLRLLRV